MTVEKFKSVYEICYHNDTTDTRLKRAVIAVIKKELEWAMDELFSGEYCDQTDHYNGCCGCKERMAAIQGRLSHQEAT